MAIGAHMSIAGGVRNAPARGVEVGCECLQVFTRSNVRWSFPPLDPADAAAFKAAIAQTGLCPVIAHSCYLVNLASGSDFIRGKSSETLLDELRRCHALGIRDLVMHPGSNPAGRELAIEMIADGLNSIFAKTAKLGVRVLLETTAGQGSQVGGSFAELRAIIDRIKCSDSERIGVCVDTCHVFAAGYDIRTEAAYRSTFDEFDRIIGLERIGAFHANDCKRDLGSKVDRHQHIGRGKLGTEPFRLLLHDPRFRHLPFIIETPKHDGERSDWDVTNIELMKKLREGA